MGKIALSDVKIGERLRKEYGNVEELALSLDRHGLIHPIVIDAENNLVCGGRRLLAALHLGWDEIEYRDFGALSEKERRLIELEENIRRKDLTPYERSNKLAEMAETTAEVLREEAVVPEELEFCADSAQKPAPHRPAEPGSLRDVSERISVPVKTIHDAKRHAETANAYPFMQSPDWKQTHVLEAREHLNQMSNPQREVAAKMLSEPGIPPSKALMMLSNLRHMPEEKRDKVLAMYESTDQRERTLAKTQAAEVPTSPDPRILKLKAARREVLDCIERFPEDHLTARFRELSDQMQLLIDDTREEHQARTARLLQEINT